MQGAPNEMQKADTAANKKLRSHFAQAYKLALLSSLTIGWWYERDFF